MENSIEMIWKQGFLNESSLVAPKINDLYNQKSLQVVDRIKRRMRNQRTFSLMMALFTPILYYFIGVFWYGLAWSIMSVFMLWYTKDIITTMQTLDQGATSYDYLKSFDRCLKDIFVKGEKIIRYSFPVGWLFGFSVIWAFWSKHGTFLIMQQRFPAVNVQLCVLAYLAALMLLGIVFSVKMYRWEVRLVYGRLFNKLEETIAEMEKLKQGE